jgi:hypothetical protein
MARRGRLAGVIGFAGLVGCALRPPFDAAADGAVPADCVAPTTFAFVPDTGASAEAYVCFGFDSGALAATIGRVTWTPPASGPFLLHHAKLYAVPGDFPDGPVACDGMPADAVGLDVWAPGTSELALPPDTGLVLPAGTRRLVVEAHTLRVAAGEPRPAAVALCAGPAAPANLAALMRASAPVPAIRPHHEEASSADCALAGDLQLWSVWPHMHLIGEEIALELVQPDATQSLVDVAPWNFLAQKRYPLAVHARAGDRIRTSCRWNNTGDAYVFPGPLSENEMCNAAFIAWPATAASCAAPPP